MLQTVTSLFASLLIVAILPASDNEGNEGEEEDNDDDEVDASKTRGRDRRKTRSLGWVLAIERCVKVKVCLI